jgi:hypothetical protein
MNTKVGDNFVPHNLDAEFAIFGVRTWEIWCRQGRAVKQESLANLILWKPSLLSHARQGGAHPKNPQGCKYNPLGVPRGLPIHIRPSGSREAVDESCRSWRMVRIDLHRRHRSTASCLSSWWSSFIGSCNGSWYVVTNSCLDHNLLFLCWWCLMLKVWSPCFSGHSRGSRQPIVIINRCSTDYLRVVTV